MPAVSPPAKRPRPAKAYAKGAIYRIELRNFMSYRHMEIVDPGAKLNCIIGPNGTGKSSIVCAMCIGLGGPLSVTERGDKINACVHGNGKAHDENGDLITSGFVEIELWDGLAEGQNLTVRVEFNMDNKETWKLAGQPSTKTRVKEALKALRIAVDNPLQFLPQDKVGQFSNLTPEKLLEYTEEAIGEGLSDKHKTLNRKQVELKELKQSLGTESKTLADMEAQNEKLKKDVERWNRYQEALARIELLQGKRLWLDYAAARQEYDDANATYKEKKKLYSEKKQEFNERKERLKPLEESVRKCKAAKQKAEKEYGQLDEQRLRIGEGELGSAEDMMEDLNAALQRVDADLRKKQKNVEKLEVDKAAAVENRDEEIRAVETRHGKPLLEAMQVARQDLETANNDLYRAQNDLEDHDQPAASLRKKLNEANSRLAALGDVRLRKQRMVIQKAQDAAKLAGWMSSSQEEGGPGFTENEVLGPLVMHIDIKNKLHAQLAEQAFGKKHPYAFVARTTAARDTLNRYAEAKKLQVNVYKYEGSDWAPPPNRPSSKDMAEFGVEAWLDETISVEPHLQGEVMGSLSMLMNVESFLLATEKAVGCIDRLQQYLASKNYAQVKILTPTRTYTTSRSRYGNRELLSSSTIPHPVAGTFSNVVDTALKTQCETDVQQAQRALEEHEKARSALTKCVEERRREVDAVARRKREVDADETRVKSLRSRVEQYNAKLEKAIKEVDAFDAAARKEKTRQELRDAHRKIARITARLSEIVAKQTAAVAEVNGFEVELKAVQEKLTDSHQETQELENLVARLHSESKKLKTIGERAAERVFKVQEDAKAKAPHFDPENRDEDAEAKWSELPDTLDDIEDEIAALEEETGAEVGASENSLRQYKEREEKIAQVRERMAESEQTCQYKASELKELENEWKPQLEDMVKNVNESFAKYFSRFRCVGEVALTDGRKRDADGQILSEEDDYSNYKIHIKVKWRANEQLHVLGEAGRDSGGERSVATMVYLIALQNINPAPFRVVDEINQAMDSSNERNVFECITHACKDGGKQYFLLTPKLLPDLDYGDDTAIQLVFNGPYMLPRQDFNLARFC